MALQEMVIEVVLGDSGAYISAIYRSKCDKIWLATLYIIEKLFKDPIKPMGENNSNEEKNSWNLVLLLFS